MSQHTLRIQKVLEDANIKLDSVLSSVVGKSGRAMLKALIEGEEDPERLADLAQGTARKKHAALVEALRGDLCGRTQAAESLGMTETSFAIYGLIADPRPTRLAEHTGVAYNTKIDESKKELAGILEEQLEPQVTIVDWVTKDDVQKEMRRVIKRQLRAAGFAAEKIDPMAESVVDLMKRRRGR